MNWADATRSGEVVIRGTLTNNSIVNVLLAVSLSRQFTGVELHNNDEGVEGRVYVKAGQVLAAETVRHNLVGLEAFRYLMAQPLKSYVVYRFPTPQPYPEPLARLGASLLAGPPPAERPTAAATPAPVAAPAPVATPAPVASPPLARPAMVLGKIVVLVFIILFIQRRPQGLFALRGRVEA